MVQTVLAVDVGGTFTDCVAWSGRSLQVAKIPTTADQSEGVMQGTARLAGTETVAGLLHGSTVATNALLEKAGAPTLLVTDEGFEDVIEIGRQDRPSLYDSFSDRPVPLVPREGRFGVGVEFGDIAKRVAGQDTSASVAISLAYSYRDPGREEELARLLEPTGLPLSLSSRVAPEFREFERTSTTVLNAYLGPPVGGYLARLSRRSRSQVGRVQVMRSSGGLMDIGEAEGLAAALLLSGPAGGVVAAAEMGRAHGYGRVITFDMGGTSTDVCRIEDGRPEVSYERTVDGYVCRMPSVAVHTVGAGGGSIAWLDTGGSLRVGPRSAGAHPGPAGYGRGGEDATVTDAHIVLGRIDPAGLLGGELSLDLEAAKTAVVRVADMTDMTIDAAAAGIIQVVDAHMERAVRAVSVEQGADPRRATLVAFGGAGGLHATSLARRLGMARVAIPPLAGVLSALGLLMAPPRRDAARSVLIASDDGHELAGAMTAVADEAAAAYREGHGSPPNSVTGAVDMRYRGQAHEITVPIPPGTSFAGAEEAFHRLHADINGFSRPGDPVEAVTVRAVAVGEAVMTWDDLPRLDEGPTPPPRTRRIRIDGDLVSASVWRRPDLPAGAEITGPAVVEEVVGTTVLGPGETATVVADGTLEVTL